MASWLLAELVRIFHDVPLHEAQAAVDTLVERRHPLVWEIDGTKRVLDPTMKKGDQSLVLLYSAAGWTNVDELVRWVEYSSVAMYRSRVLTPLHNDRLVEYQSSDQRVRITPLGVSHTEANLLRTLD